MDATVKNEELNLSASDDHCLPTLQFRENLFHRKITRTANQRRFQKKPAAFCRRWFTLQYRVLLDHKIRELRGRGAVRVPIFGYEVCSKSKNTGELAAVRSELVGLQPDIAELTNITSRFRLHYFYQCAQRTKETVIGSRVLSGAEGMEMRSVLVAICLLLVTPITGSFWWVTHFPLYCSFLLHRFPWKY